MNVRRFMCILSSHDCTCGAVPNPPAKKQTESCARKATPLRGESKVVLPLWGVQSEQAAAFRWSLCDNRGLRVIPRSPPLLLADDEESRSDCFKGSRSCPSAGGHPETVEMREAPWSAVRQLTDCRRRIPCAKAVAVRRLTDTALQGAFGTGVFGAEILRPLESHVIPAQAGTQSVP